MRKIKLLLLSVLLCFGIVFVSACGEEPEVVLSQEIHVSQSNVELTVGEFCTITVSIAPLDVTSKDFEVLMLTEGVVTVDYDKENMQFSINAPNQIENGFDVVELEVRTTDGGNANTHLSVKINERSTVVEAPQNINFSNGSLVWSQVLGAQGYIVNLNGTDMPMVYTNEYAIDSSLVGKPINAKVYAVGEFDSVSSGYAEFTFQILSAPTGLDYDNGTISWQAVEGATGYYVYFDGKVEYCEFTQISIADRFDTPKVYQIKVMAVGDPDNNIENSVYCDAIEVEKLAIPQNIRIENGTLVWDAVQNRDSYKVSLNGNAPVETLKTSLVLPLDLPAGNHFVKVQAIGDEKYYITSAESPALDFEKLQAVENIYIQSGVICWDANLLATSYMLYVNGMPYQTTSIEVTSVDFSKYGSGTYNLQVMAIGNGGNILNANMSQNFEATKLTTPLNMRIEVIDGYNYFVWDAVSNANGYNVVFNDADPVVIYENKFLMDVASGTYTIKVQALGDSTKFISSNYSQLVATTKLAEPQNLSVKNGIVCWDRVAGVGKYKVLIDGTTVVETTSNQFDMQSTDDLAFEARQYEVKVMALANDAANINGDYCQSIVVTKLAVPQIAVRYGKFVNATVQDGYAEYNVEVFDQTDRKISSYKSYNIETLGGTSYLKYVVSAKAMAAADTLYVNSDLSQSLTAIQLPQIRANDIKIENGLLKYATNTYAELTEGFKFNLEISKSDGSLQTLVHDPLVRQYDLSNYVAEQYSCTISAVANYNQNGESLVEVPHLNSQATTTSFKVLAAPTNVKITGIADTIVDVSALLGDVSFLKNQKLGQLVWDKVDDARLYSVRVDGVEKLQTTANYCDIKNYIASCDTDVQISICAIGNNGNVLTSKYSEQIACQKLSAPTNLSCNGSSVSWSSQYNNSVNLANATGNTVVYIIDINGTQYVTLQGIDILSPSASFESKTYSLPSLPAGQYAAKIYAVPLNAYLNGMEISTTTGTQFVASDFSSNIYMESLMTPQSVAMNNVEGRQILSWSGLQYQNGEVDKYIVVIDKEGTKNEVEINFGTNQYVFAGYTPGIYTFNVYAKAKTGATNVEGGKTYYYVNSNLSNEVVSFVMETPELYLNNGVLNWNNIAGVDKYLLTFGKVGQTQSTLEFDSRTTKFELGEQYEPGDYTFKIMAKGDGKDFISSTYSSVQTFTKLQAVTGIKISNGAITYDENSVVAQNNNMCYYKICVSNNTSFINEKLLATELSGYASATYSVYVVAVGDNKTYLSADASETISCTKLAKPSSPYVSNGAMVWGSAANASGYQLNISGAIVNASGQSFDFATYAASTYTVKVRALGNNTSYVNGDWSMQSSITKLAEIKDIRVQDGVVTWTKPAGAYNNVKLKIKAAADAEYTEISIPANTNTFVLDGAYAAGNYMVCMYNAGGTNAISSKTSDVVNVTKLAAPQNLRITADQKIAFDAVGNAGSYTLQIVLTDGSAKHINLTSTSVAIGDLKTLNPDVSIESSGTYKLSVLANGTTSPFVNSNYSSVLTITKPSAPLLQPEMDGDIWTGKIVWDQVANADKYKISVQVYNSGNLIGSTDLETTNNYWFAKENGDYNISIIACKTVAGFDSEPSVLENLTFGLFAAGDGSVNNPYQINSVQQFNCIVYNPTAHYKLNTNIDFEGKTVNALTQDFAGSLDGCEFTISNFKLSTNNNIAALIPVVAQSGVIKNLKISTDIAQGAIVGGIAGKNYGLVQNCVVMGNVSPVHNSTDMLYVGGIVGINYGQIVKCLNKAAVQPQNNQNIIYAGGIAGSNMSANGIQNKISGCGNTGAVNGYYAGGLVASSEAGNIEKSYNTAAVSATNGIYAGGLVGYAAASGTINACYNIGAVSASNTISTDAIYAGGLIGYNNGYAVSNCYATNCDIYGNATVMATGASRCYFAVLVGYNEQGDLTSDQTNLAVCRTDADIDYHASNGGTKSDWIKHLLYYSGFDVIYNNLDSTYFNEVVDGYPTLKDAKY